MHVFCIFDEHTLYVVASESCQGLGLLSLVMHLTEVAIACHFACVQTGDCTVDSEKASLYCSCKNEIWPVCKHNGLE